MKINKHVMAMNLAAVIAFGAVAGIVAPSVTGNDSIVAFAATTDGNAVTDGNAEVTAEEENKAADTKGATATVDKSEKALKGCTVVYNGDGKTATFKKADKKAKKIVVPASFKNAAGKTIKITALDKNAFKGCKAETIDVSKIKLKKLQSKQFNGASKVKTLKINAKGIKKAKDINKNFVKGNKKLTKINVVATKNQWKKLESKFNTAAKKTGAKKAPAVKRVNK